MQLESFGGADTAEEGFGSPVAVLDSNVLVEAVSCVDLVKHYERPGFDLWSVEATLRRQKARESLLLSMHLDSVNATTFSLLEAIRITLREVDPEATDRFENHAMTLWVHYVKGSVLPNWVMTSPSSDDAEPTGNRADALLVERARELGVPLISHEGVTTSGVDCNCGIRRKARAAGVAIVTPREFFGRVDELLYSAMFLQRFDSGTEAYIRASAQPEFTRESLDYLRGYYMHVLYGITNDERDPLPIRLSSAGVGLTVEQCVAESSA